MFRNVIVIGLAALVIAGSSPALADTNNNAATTNNQVRLLLAPLSTLGSEAKSRATNKIKRILVAGLRSVGGHTLVSERSLKRALRKARKSRLRNCDGKVGCLAELGKLVNAQLVVHAEVGGLGAVQVVYLKLVKAAGGKEVRATTLELGRTSNSSTRARSAAMRLLAPERFVGTLVTQVDVKGANIYVDGQKLATSPAGPIKLSVGTHALRVTHPEFRDSVRFVTIEFEKAATVKADMLQFPIVSSGMNPNNTGSQMTDPATSNVIYRGVMPTPWYKKWYAVAGAAAVVFFTSAVTVGLIADGISVDREKTVRPPM